MTTASNRRRCSPLDAIVDRIKGQKRMDLRFSIAARDRAFGRAMRRIRPKFDSLVEAFAMTELVDPIHKAILVGMTDDKEPEVFEEVPNRDGYFQVLAGIRMQVSDLQLTKDVFEILRRAANACPFSKPDHQAIQRVFEAFEATING